MPIVGERRSRELGKGYENHPMHEYVANFRDLAMNILEESKVDIFSEPTKLFIKKGAEDALHDFFVNESADENGFLTAKDYDDHMKMMHEQFLNDKEAIQEYATMGSYNPVIGMGPAVHKNILMNNIWDKGIIPKAVALSPKFPISMETRKLITPDGKEIDMWKEQDKMTAAIDSTLPFVDVEMTLPEIGATDVLAQMGASTLDNLGIETYISAVKVPCKFKKDEKLPDGTIATEDTVADVWLNTRIKFRTAYGDYARSVIEPVTLPANVNSTEVEEIITGTMHKNRFNITGMKGIAKAVKITARKDASNGLLPTCTVRWDIFTDLIEIGNAIPINVAISPEEVKDIAALYNVNQLTKVMSMIKIAMENYKDDKIKENIDDSFVRMPANQKMKDSYNLAPRAGYALDHIEWRNKTFMDFLDTKLTDMLEVLRDPNMIINVVGRTDIIRKITPTDYTYTSPNSIGPVELDFVKTVCTSDKRIYQFISSQKLRGSNELIIILCPRNTDRIMYIIYDYQMYVSNEIRNAVLSNLPSIHAFERWKFEEFQPVQGRLEILNPTGMPAA